MKKYNLIKLLTIALILVVVIGCGEDPAPPPKVDKALGDTIEMREFRITFINFTLREPIKGGDNLIFLEVEVENKTKKDLKFPHSLYNIYNPRDLLLNKITNSAYTTDITSYSAIRAGGKTTGHIIFPFDGYGTYTLIFKDKYNNETLKFNVFE